MAAPAAAAAAAAAAYSSDDEDDLTAGFARGKASVSASRHAAKQAAATRRAVDTDVLFGRRRSTKQATAAAAASSSDGDGLVRGLQNRKARRFAKINARKRAAKDALDVPLVVLQQQEDLRTTKKVKKDKKRKKQKRATADEQVDEDGSAGGSLALAGSSVPATLTFNQLYVGMPLLGVVTNVSEMHVTVGLPDGLSGRLSLGQVSDGLAEAAAAYLGEEQEVRGGGGGGESESKNELPNLAEYVSVGQLLPVVITRLTGKTSGSSPRRIYLSAQSSLVNGQFTPEMLVPGLCLSASIVSVQDNGYIVDLGVPLSSAINADHVTGFVPFADSSSDATMRPGQPVRCLVSEQAASSRAVKLSMKPEEVLSSRVPVTMTMPFGSLQPGMLVSGRVTTVSDAGLSVKFLKFFQGAISINHLPLGTPIESFSEGDAIADMRILWIDMPGKRIALTMLGHLVQQFSGASFPEECARGKIYPNAQVIRTTAHRGVYLVADDESDEQIQLFAHISNLSSRRITQPLSKLFPDDSQKPARVLGLNRLEGHALCTLDPAVIAQPILSYEDVTPGSLVNATVVSQDDQRGLVISLAPRIRAVVPKAHMGYSSSNPSPGSKVRVRILTVDAEKRKAKATMLPQLVRSTLDIISSYNDVATHLAAERAGDADPLIAHGIVQAIKPFGVILRFFNNVTGLAAGQGACGLSGNQSYEDAFSVGQVVKARLVTCQPKRQRIGLSLEVDATSGKRPVALSVLLGSAPEEGGSRRVERDSADAFDFIGSIVGGSVICVVDEEDPTLIVRLADENNSLARLPAAHLTDHPENAKLLLRLSRKPGTEFSQLLILKSSSKVHSRHARIASASEDAPAVYEVSAKPMLLQAARGKFLPRDSQSLAVGTVVPGFVRALTNFGAFVEFLNGAVALAPKSALADTFVSKPESHFLPGQTVRAVVTDVSEDKASVSLKTSAVGSDLDADGAFATSLFLEQDQIASAALAKLRAKGKPAVDLQREYPIGSLVSAEVGMVRDFGIVLSLPDGVLGVVAFRNPEEREDAPGVGEVIQGVILDQKPSKQIVDVSRSPELISAAKSSRRKKRKSKSKSKDSDIAHGHSTTAVVQLVRAGHIIVTLPEAGHQVAFAAATSFNLALSAHSLFRPGFRCPATVHAPEDGASRDLHGRTIVVLDLSARIGKLSQRLASRGAGAFWDPSLSQRKQIRPGRIISVKVSGVSFPFVFVSFGADQQDRILGRIHVSELDLSGRGGGGGGGSGSDDDESSSDPENDESSAAYPLDKYSAMAGQLIRAKVLYCTRPASKRAKTGADGVRAPKHEEHQLIANLTVRPEDLSTPGRSRRELFEASTYHRGSTIPVCFVSRASEEAVFVVVSPNVTGRIPASALSSEISHMRRGRVLRNCVVMRSADQSNGHLILAPADSIAASEALQESQNGRYKSSDRSHDSNNGALADGPDMSDVQLGQVYEGRISNIKLKHHLDVQLSPTVFVRVHITELADDWPAAPFTGFRVGQMVDVAVVEKSKGRGSSRLEGSLRPSVLRAVRKGKVKASVLRADAVQTARAGDIVSGYISSLNDKGCWVYLNRDCTGRVKLKNLSDVFIAHPKKVFEIGRLVQAKVLEVDERGHVQLTMKASDVHPESRLLDLADFEEGQLVKGLVRKVENFGVFVTLKRSRVSGLAHISEISDQFIKNLGKHYRPGDKVRARILEIDRAKRRISLGLKESHLRQGVKRSRDDDEDESDGSDVNQEAGSESGSDSDAGNQQSVDSDEDEDQLSSSDDERQAPHQLMAGDAQALDSMAPDRGVLPGEDMLTMVDEDEGASSSEDDSEDQGQKALALDVAAVGAAMEDSDSEDSSDSSSDDSDDADSRTTNREKKLSRRAKAAAKRREKRAIALREEQLRDTSRLPSSADDFERLVVESPNSSIVWIQYMGWQVSLAEIAKARAIAERALKTISFRDETEKFNVWVALLNLEAQYGTEETLEAAKKRALQFNDALEVRLKLADILAELDKDEAAEAEFKEAAKKFKIPRVYEAYGRWLYSCDRLKDARQLMRDALERLGSASRGDTASKKDQTELVLKFATLEFKMGSAERGRTLFESLVSTHGRRLDIWSVWLDQELRLLRHAERHSSVEGTRRVFDRVTSLNLSTKKMKWMLKRFLAFEKDHGDEESTNLVKDKARAYVAAKNAMRDGGAQGGGGGSGESEEEASEDDSESDDQ